MHDTAGAEYSRFTHQGLITRRSCLWTENRAGNSPAGSPSSSSGVRSGDVSVNDSA